MTVKGKKNSEKDKMKILWDIDIARKINSGSERNLAKTLNCTSVEEVVDFSSRNGLLIKCACGHEKIKHIDLKLLEGSSAHNFNDALTRCSLKNCTCVEYKNPNHQYPS